MELTDIFVLAVGLLSILTNGVLLLILLKDPLKCFKASTTYFIISLSVSDLLTGTNACFWAVHKLVAFSPNFQRYLLSLFWVTTQASFLTLLAMSVERFVIVKYPLYCRMWITKKRVSLFIAFIWLVSAILGGLILLPPPKQLYVQFSIFTEFFLSVFVIAGLYAFILFGIKNSQKSVKGAGQLHQGGAANKTHQLQITRSSTRQKNSYQVNVTDEPNPTQEKIIFRNGSPIPRTKAPGATENGGRKTGTETGPEDKTPGEGTYPGDKTLVESNSRDINSSEESVEFSGPLLNCNAPRKDLVKTTQAIMQTRQRRRNLQQENKLTAVVLLLVGVLALTVLPYLLASQIYVGYIIFCQCPASPGLAIFTGFYFPIELLNFAVNPLIYAWRLPQYRKTLRHLCSCYQSPANMDITSTCDRDARSFRNVSVKIRETMMTSR